MGDSYPGEWKISTDLRALNLARSPFIGVTMSNSNQMGNVGTDGIGLGEDFVQARASCLIGVAGRLPCTAVLTATQRADTQTVRRALPERKCVAELQLSVCVTISISLDNA
jgi:hypothetical protein